MTLSNFADMLIVMGFACIVGYGLGNLIGLLVTAVMDRITDRVEKAAVRSKEKKN